MRFYLAVILIAVFSGVIEYFMPWWSVAVVPFAVALLMQPGRAFWAGFLGVGVCWLVVAIARDVQNGHILSSRMAALFHLPHYSLFITVTVVIGALVGGLAAGAGALLRRR